MLQNKKNILLLSLFFFSFIFAFFSIHIRVKTTLLGYDIGKLKSRESKLLKENSLLTMELTKISSKKWLLNFLKEKKKQ